MDEGNIIRRYLQFGFPFGPISFNYDLLTFAKRIVHDLRELKHARQDVGIDADRDQRHKNGIPSFVFGVANISDDERVDVVPAANY